jgi:hypothetical protein
MSALQALLDWGFRFRWLAPPAGDVSGLQPYPLGERPKNTNVSFLPVWFLPAEGTYPKAPPLSPRFKIRHQKFETRRCGGAEVAEFRACFGGGKESVVNGDEEG